MKTIINAIQARKIAQTSDKMKEEIFKEIDSKIRYAAESGSFSCNYSSALFAGNAEFMKVIMEGLILLGYKCEKIHDSQFEIKF